MLGKLIKHEFRSTYKVGAILAATTLVVTFMSWISFQSPFWRSMFDDQYGYSANLLDIFSLIVPLMYVFMLVGVTYGALIYLGVHFYSTMYTDRGYLTHTLPVGKHQLLLSKFLVSGLWLLAINILVFFSVVVVIGTFVKLMLPEGYTLAELWANILDLIDDLFSLLNDGQGANFISYFWLLILNEVLSPFITVAILFGSVTVGQLFTKVRVFMAIVCYLGALMVNRLFASFVQTMLGDIYRGSDVLGAVINTGVLSTLIIQLIVAVLLYFASYLIVTKRLNME